MPQINEPIRVAVIFGPGSAVRPVWFDWRSRKHTITRTTYNWSKREGRATLLHFSVMVEEDLYELVYNTASQAWSLLDLQC